MDILAMATSYTIHCPPYHIPPEGSSPPTNLRLRVSYCKQSTYKSRLLGGWALLLALWRQTNQLSTLYQNHSNHGMIVCAVARWEIYIVRFVAQPTAERFHRVTTK